jgi:hypothetical protein
VMNQTISNWPPGAALWLVWQMTDSTGKAQGLGMDNFSFSAGAPPAPVPLGIQISGTSLLLAWPTAEGQNYQLEVKTNLSDAVWTPLGSPVPGTGGTVTLTNGIGNSPQLFFRLEQVN